MDVTLGVHCSRLQAIHRSFWDPQNKFNHRKLPIFHFFVLKIIEPNFPILPLQNSKSHKKNGNFCIIQTINFVLFSGNFGLCPSVNCVFYLKILDAENSLESPLKGNCSDSEELAKTSQNDSFWFCAWAVRTWVKKRQALLLLVVHFQKPS